MYLAIKPVPVRSATRWGVVLSDSGSKEDGSKEVRTRLPQAEVHTQVVRRG